MARGCRITICSPWVLAMLPELGEPNGFGISAELLMLASRSAAVAVIAIGSSSDDDVGTDRSSRTGGWSGHVVLVLLSELPLLTAAPSLLRELATSKLLHDPAVSRTELALGFSEQIPAAALLLFMLHRLAGYGTLHLVLPKTRNSVINLGILVLIPGSYIANRLGSFDLGKVLVGILMPAHDRPDVLRRAGAARQPAAPRQLPPRSSQGQEGCRLKLQSANSSVSISACVAGL